MDRSFYGMLCGTLCVERGWLTPTQLAAAVAEWKSSGQGSVLDVLVQRGQLTTENRQKVQEEINRRFDESAADVARTLKTNIGSTEVDRLWAEIGLKSAPIRQSDERRYSLGPLLGTGSNGQVKVALDVRLGREIAFKELRPEHVHDPQRRREFVKEARITSQIEHPAVVPIYDVGATEAPFYAMKLIRGRNLNDVISDYWKRRQAGANDPMELRGLLGAFLKACEAVGSAHAKGIVHRDLKPANIVVEDFGEVFVIDWGLALEKTSAKPSKGDGQHIALGESSREATTVIGSPGYLAPEQAAGRSDQVDGRSDIYALGAILYRILVGQSPHVAFQCSTSEETLARIAAGPAPRASAALRGVPKGLDAICAKAMAHQPADRYATATEFAADIERWLAREPVSAHSEPWTKRAVRWSLKNRTATIGAFLVILFVTVIGISRSILLWREHELQELNEFNNLAGQARFSEVAIGGLIRRLQDQLHFLGLSRVVNELAAATIEAQPEKKEAARRGVAELFVELMRQEPNVSGLQFVQKEPKSIELVRVARDSQANAPILVPDKELADVSENPRIRTAMQLKPGEISLSSAIRPASTGSSQNGITLTGAMPVYHQNRPIGVVSVEVDFGSFLVALFENTQEPNRLVCVANDLGQMLLVAPAGQPPRLAETENPTDLAIPTELKTFLAEPDRPTTHIIRCRNGELAYCSRIRFDPLPPHHFVSLAIGRRYESIETAPIGLKLQALAMFAVSYLVLLSVFFAALWGLWRLARGLD